GRGWSFHSRGAPRGRATGWYGRAPGWRECAPGRPGGPGRPAHRGSADASARPEAVRPRVCVRSVRTGPPRPRIPQTAVVTHLSRAVAPLPQSGDTTPGYAGGDVTSRQRGFAQLPRPS